MKVTVCELNDSVEHFAQNWEELVKHVREQQSDLVLLPEMPFYPWFGTSPDYDEDIWQKAVAEHDRWQERFVELSPAIVLGSRPVIREGKRLNEAFCWDEEEGYRTVHDKYYLPNEEGFWEAEWYNRGDGSFGPIECKGTIIGVQICTELWAFEHARTYGKQGVHLIVTPRATPKTSLENWLVGGQATAITSGAFSLSSNRVSSASNLVHFGGQGWVISPDGKILATTSAEKPFVTVKIDLSEAEQSKLTYPRYVF